MRRLVPSSQRCVLTAAASAAISPPVQRRSIYSQWGTTDHDPAVTKGTTFLERLTRGSGQRSFALFHTPRTAVLPGAGGASAATALTEPEVYLHSALSDDTQRLLRVDWTTELDPFWRDRVESHAVLYDTLYGDATAWGVRRLIFGRAAASSTAAGAEGALSPAQQEAQSKLAYLRSVLKWAEQCEACYSSIYKARFSMQRGVFCPIEREKILAGCVAMCNTFKAEVPAEFRRKATQDLEWHLGILRHWVWDCPNAKQHFPRELA